MKPNPFYNIASQQVSLLPNNVAQIEGFFRGTTADRWLQVHDTCTTPVNGATPLWQIPIYQTSAFFQNLQVAHLPITEGIFIGISTTEGSWAASTDTMDLTLWTENPVATAHLVGDKTTTLNTLPVWPENDANVLTNRLFGLIVTEQLGAPGFVLVYADDAKLGKINSIHPLAANQTLKLSYGHPALKPQTAGVSAPTATAPGYRLGCTVVVANAVPAEGNAPVVSANKATVLAIKN